MHLRIQIQNWKQEVGYQVRDVKSLFRFMPEAHDHLKTLLKQFLWKPLDTWNVGITVSFGMEDLLNRVKKVQEVISDLKNVGNSRSTLKCSVKL